MKNSSTDTITKEQLETNIQQYGAVMVYFSGENCGVCNVLKPQVQNLLNSKYPKIKQFYIEANNSQLYLAFGVFTVPTVIVYFDNKEFIRKSRNFGLVELENELARPYKLFFS